MSDENLRFDDVVIGWSDTTPNSATASATSGGGYVKLDDSFLTGETIVTLPVSKKLYAVDENGNLKKDDNGNAIEASWNEQSLHKLRKGFITSVSSSPLSLVYKAGSQGVGFLARTTTINLAVAAATRFSNSRQRSKYITCDATFINPNDPASMTSADGSPGRFTIKNAKLNVLCFEPKYNVAGYDSDDEEEDHGHFHITTSTDLQVDDSVMYQIDEDNDLDKPGRSFGHLNIGLDFESISRAEAWDAFLNEVAGTRKSTNRTALGLAGLDKYYNNTIMRLELSIHKNNPKSSKEAIGSPTFSFFVILLPRDNLKVEYDVSSPYVSRNYSFQIIEPSEGDVKFSFIAQDHKKGKNISWNFTLIGQLSKREGIEIEEVQECDDTCADGELIFADVYSKDNNSEHKNYISTATDDVKLMFSTHSDIRVIFKIKNVALLSGGEKGVEFDKMAIGDGNSPYSPTIDLHGGQLSKAIDSIVSHINDGLANGRKYKTSSHTIFDSSTLPILTLRRHYGHNIVESRNFFDFVSKGDSPQFIGIQLIENYFRTGHRMNNSLLSFEGKAWEKNFVKMAVYFSFKHTDGSSVDNWETIK